jgi:hypothetical protein
MKFVYLILLINLFLSTVFSQVDANNYPNNDTALKKLNLQISISGPFILNVGLTYKLIDNYGVSFSFLPTNYVFKGYFKTGIFYQLIEQNVPEKPVNFSLSVGFNTAIVDYPHFWSKYSGRCYWVDAEANFGFRSGINLFVRNGVGYIKEKDNQKFIGPLLLVPEVGIGYKF